MDVSLDDSEVMICVKRVIFDELGSAYHSANDDIYTPEQKASISLLAKLFSAFQTHTEYGSDPLWDRKDIKRMIREMEL